MQTGLAGIKSNAPWFKSVIVAPQPGNLKEISAKHPHPVGFIEVELKFSRGKVSGTVKTPVEGVFVWRGKRVALSAGENSIDM
jgi:hypothetical protein